MSCHRVQIRNCTAVLQNILTLKIKTAEIDVWTVVQKF